MSNAESSLDSMQHSAKRWRYHVQTICEDSFIQDGSTAKMFFEMVALRSGLPQIHILSDPQSIYTLSTFDLILMNLSHTFNLKALLIHKCSSQAQHAVFTGSTFDSLVIFLSSTSDTHTIPVQSASDCVGSAGMFLYMSVYTTVHF